MRPPIGVRAFTDDERQTLEDGLRSPDAFVLRRCQMLLASARGIHAPQIACSLGCGEQTVRNVLHGVAEQGLAVLTRRSSRPHTVHAAFDAAAAERLQVLLHQSPRDFGLPTSLWTLALLAEVCAEQGMTPTRVSAETIRVTLRRLGIRWQRAKAWIVSPDPAYAQKKPSGIG